jgi:hypothetical protein
MTVPIHFASVIQHAWKQQDRISIAAARRSGKTHGLLEIMKDMAYQHMTSSSSSSSSKTTAEFLFLTDTMTSARHACDLFCCDMLKNDSRFAPVKREIFGNRHWLDLYTYFANRRVSICFYRDLPKIDFPPESWPEKHWYGEWNGGYSANGPRIQAVFVDEPGFVDPKALELLKSKDVTWKLLFAGTPGDNEEHKARWKLPQHFEFSMVRYTSTKQVEAVFTPSQASESSSSSSSSSSCTEHEE